MTKISLRAYNREIEKLIDHGQTEEATAHCKYILKLFPKHIDTYRLLGKAYLESQRYSEAADILQRVLAVTPDDFVSQIGLSIIREDEGNLDAAIWNMERAFEVQPSNAAVQDELRRLYGNRDGVEPPRVRLTRGALVRMYTRGELYQQAIAEARAAISEDPKRVDLEILLARNYYLSKNYVEATEICARLVKKLPYCYEANWILSEILPTINKSDEAKVFTKRVQELDPYAAFIDRSTPTSAQVPEDTVTLEKLEWMPSMETSEQPQWAKSIGIQIESDAEQNAENWLENLSTPQQGEVTPLPFIVPEVSQPKSEDSIPEWMREDGGSKDLETTDHGTTGQSNAFIFDEPESSPEEAHLPEWLQSMKPEDADLGQPDIASTTSTNAKPQDLSDLPDWMREIESGPFDHPDESRLPEPSTKLPDWGAMDITAPDDTSNAFISSAAGIAEESASLSESEDLSEMPEIEPAENVPDWLKDLEQTAQVVEDEPAQETASIRVSPFSAQETASEESPQPSDIPDWLKEYENTPSQEAETLVGSNAFSIDETTQQEEVPAEEYQPPQLAEQKADAVDSVPDWLREFDASSQTVPDDLSQEETSIADSIPDWLQELDKPSSAPFTQESAESPALSSTQPDEEPDWLSAIPDGQEPKNPDPNQDLTDWLSEMEADQDSLETPPTAEATTSSAEAESLPSATKPEEIDEAFAWLESLAAKHGAEEEALSTPEEERKTDVPDWLQEMGEAQTDSTSEPAGLDQPDQEKTEDLHEWLGKLTSDQDEIDQPSAAQADILPDWLQTLGDEEHLLEDTRVEEINTPFDAQPATPQSTDMSSPLESGELLPATDIPDWLQELDAETDTQADFSPAAQAEEMPDWLSELGQEERHTLNNEVDFEPSIDQTSSNIENLNKPAAPMEEDEQPHDAVISGWLTELEGSTDAEDEIAPAVQAEDFPDWLKEIGQEEPETDDITNVSDHPLGDDGQIQTSSEGVLPQPAEEELSATIEDLDDFAATQDGKLPAQAEDTLSVPLTEESTITDEDDAFAWLESLAARHGADEEALVTSTEERSDIPPEWIQELGKEEIQENDLDQPVDLEGMPETLSISDLDTGVDILGSSQVEVEPENIMLEDKEAQAREWLQSLASGKSNTAQEPTIDEANEEIFFEASSDDQATESSGENDGLPMEAAAQEQTEIQALDDVAEDEIPDMAEQGLDAELPDWLKDISEPTVEEKKAKLEPSGNHTVTSWLRDLDEKRVETEPEPAIQFEQTESTSDEQDSPLTVVQEETSAPIAETQPEIEEDHLPSPELQEAVAMVEEYAEKQLTAHKLLRDGQIEQAVTIYEELIKEEENLDAVIKDLNDALYDHPVDTVLWLTLGNAYTQKREMQNALTAYTKAEELLK